MKKIYRFNANNSCLFSVSHSPKKAIAQVASKIKSADSTNVLVLNWQYCCNS